MTLLKGRGGEPVFCAVHPILLVSGLAKGPYSSSRGELLRKNGWLRKVAKALLGVLLLPPQPRMPPFCCPFWHPPTPALAACFPELCPLEETWLKHRGV